MKKIIVFALLLMMTIMSSSAKVIKTQLKVLCLFIVCFWAICFLACNGHEENEQQPLSVVDYCEVALGDTTQLIVTGGSGNVVVTGNVMVEASCSSSQNDNQQRVSLIGKSLGTTNIVVQDNTTKESCNVEVQVVHPFLTLIFVENEGKPLGLQPNVLFALLADKDSICYVFSYNNMQLKHNDIPIMKGKYHVSGSGATLSFDLKGEKYNFKHSFKVNDNKASNLFSNISSISTFPQTSLMMSLTDIETNTEFPHVHLGNKVQKTLPKRE